MIILKLNIIRKTALGANLVLRFSLEVALGARGFLSLLRLFHPRVSRTPKAEFSSFVYLGLFKSLITPTPREYFPLFLSTVSG